MHCVTFVVKNCPSINALAVLKDPAGKIKYKHGATIKSVLFSLECVKRHKVECGCSGKRCKTMFVKMSDFGDNQLYSGRKYNGNMNLSVLFYTP